MKEKKEEKKVQLLRGKYFLSGENYAIKKKNLGSLEHDLILSFVSPSLNGQV